MARTSKTMERERREILRIFNDRAIVPKRVIDFTIRSMAGASQAFPTRKDGEYWCDHCGGRFTMEIVKRKRDADTAKCVCPHCGARLTVHTDGIEKMRGYAYNYEKRIVKPKTHRTDHYVKEITAYKGWQVIKEYFVSKHARIGEKASFDIELVYSIWMNPETKHTHIYARRPVGIGQWSCRTPFSLRSDFYFTRSSTNSPLYNGWREYKMYDKVLPYYLIHGCDPDRDEELVFPAYTEAGTELETLTKLGYREAADILALNSRYRKTAKACWRGIVLALRHGYGETIGREGWQMYLDYLHELKELRLDWHSPHYLCPKDLRAAHAETSRRLARKIREANERRENARRRAALTRDTRRVAEFGERIKKFLPLTITGGGLVIRPLASVEEFLEEGTAMHHCVFSNAYYARPQSLILSARTDGGERVETVEVDLGRYNVVQSRAVCNGVSDRHDDIIGLVMAAMPQIKKFARAGAKTAKHKLSA